MNTTTTNTATQTIAVSPDQHGFEANMHLLKQGEGISRSDWNHNEYLVMVTSMTVPVNEDRYVAAMDEGSQPPTGEEVTFRPLIRRYHNDGTIEEGWTPNSEEMFADDWFTL